MKKTKKLRMLFNSPGLIKIVGAHDGLSAKLVERNGFDGVWASGLEISTSFALPDANILTMSQYLERACEMNDSVSIPVIADCDTGYGNSNNVIHMVKKYEAAGIAAVCIEDKKFPKVNSFIPGRQELAPIPEFVGKIMAAKNAQLNEDFMVIARVEALIAGWGMDEALKRATTYAEAGADAILIHSKMKVPDEIFEFIEKWHSNTPLVVVPTTYNMITFEKLETVGVKMSIYANHGIRAAIKSMEDVFGDIQRTGTASSVEDKIVSMGEVFEIQGIPKMRESEEKYLRDSREKVVAIIPAAGDHLEEYSMKQVSAEIPIAMLDINGKSLLQRQQEVLNKSGISHILVVAGYKKETIDVDGIKLVDNPEYQSTGILHSVFCAQANMVGKVCIIYSDILFNNSILEQLLKSDDDIVVLLDSTYESKNYGPLKKVDLVITESKPIKNRRKLQDCINKQVKKIGANIEPDEACYEFPGMMVLSPRGVQIFKDVYAKASQCYQGKQFHGADYFEKAHLSDLLQEIINMGHKVSGIEVNSGWMEVHSFDDYKLACSMVK